VNRRGFPSEKGGSIPQAARKMFDNLCHRKKSGPGAYPDSSRDTKLLGTQSVRVVPCPISLIESFG
jgi:hypothetical protein